MPRRTRTRLLSLFPLAFLSAALFAGCEAEKVEPTPPDASPVEAAKESMDYGRSQFAKGARK